MATFRPSSLPLDLAVRDAVFWDEHLLVLTTPTAEVWRVPLSGPGLRSAERLFTAEEVLGPIAREFGRSHVAPAAGGYPRVAACSRAQTVVVNTHDLVLVACPLRDGERVPRLLSSCWGHYYPKLAFSADGTRFAATEDGFLVYDAGSWQGRREDRSAHCAWHPWEAKLLCFDRPTGQLAWIDYRNSAHPTTQVLGAPALPDGVDGLLVDPAGERCIMACDGPLRLEWWQLNPLRRLDTQALEDGPIGGFPALEAHGATGLFAVESQAGVRLWSFRTHRPAAGLLPGATHLRFSPSGCWFVTRSALPGNPYSVQPTAGGSQLTRWQILP